MTPRIEYGAQIVSRAANVYMRDYNQRTVTDWMQEMASAGPCRLVMRVWDGDVHGPWMPVVPTTTRPIPLPEEPAA